MSNTKQKVYFTINYFRNITSPHRQWVLQHVCSCQHRPSCTQGWHTFAPHPTNNETFLIMCLWLADRLEPLMCSTCTVESTLQCIKRSLVHIKIFVCIWGIHWDKANLNVSNIIIIDENILFLFLLKYYWLLENQELCVTGCQSKPAINICWFVLY